MLSETLPNNFSLLFRTLDSFFIFASFTFYYMYSYNYVLLLLFVYYFLSIIFLKQGIVESFNFYNCISI